jgi:hypothetical protein
VGETIGGTGIDECYSVIQNSEDGFVIAGLTNSFELAALMF